MFVDEFQDSSPLQLAIFMALAGMVGESTWVGDPKQAIYGFRNADSALTQAAFDAVRAANGPPQQTLSESWRSRDGIVRFVNAAFGPVFSAMGLPAKDHAFTGTRRFETGFSRPPLAVWRLEGTVAEQHGALAAQVREILGDAESWSVARKADGEIRPLQAGDIAILCRSNENVGKMATALAAQGLHVSVERDGLTGTPHVQLVVAAARWVADASDRLALAELANFFADDERPDAWLQAAAADAPDDALRSVVPIVDDLNALRDRILMLTPAELVDAVLRLKLVQQRIEAWGNAGERLDDLEALRGFALGYEESCGAEGTPATLNGLILALGSDPPKRPRSLRPDAVQVTTYHRAKGLEWPLAILTDLDHAPKPRLFQPVAEADGAIDLVNPLAGRWIRFWPWPYGTQKKNVDFDERAEASPIGREAGRRAREEETRLLYVGATRARDYLVFAPPQRGEAWLELLDVGASPNHVQLPKASGDPLRAGGLSFAAEALAVSAKEALPWPGPAPAFVSRPREAKVRPPLRRRPSGDETTGAFEVTERFELGPRLPLTGDADMEAIGNALHAVFAADAGGDDMALRLERATSILSRWKAFPVQPADVIAAADRLEAHIHGRWPGRLHPARGPSFRPDRRPARDRPYRPPRRARGPLHRDRPQVLSRLKIRSAEACGRARGAAGALRQNDRGCDGPAVRRALHPYAVDWRAVACAPVTPAALG